MTFRLLECGETGLMLVRSFRKAYFCYSSLIRVKYLHCGEHLRWKWLAVFHHLCATNMWMKKRKKRLGKLWLTKSWQQKFIILDACFKNLITVFAILQTSKRLTHQKVLQSCIKAQWLTYGQSYKKKFWMQRRARAKFLFLLSFSLH